MIVTMNVSLPLGTARGGLGRTGRTSTMNAWSPPPPSTPPLSWSADTPAGILTSMISVKYPVRTVWLTASMLPPRSATAPLTAETIPADPPPSR